MTQILEVTHEEFFALTCIWEASVRATHAFLKEEDIATLRPKILNEYLPTMTLRGYHDASGLGGFIGVNHHKLEMLFLSPQRCGKGIGKTLLNYAITELKVTELDVNEDNVQARGFYEHMGFEVVGRSEKDGQGNPFPILHMRYAA